MHQELSFEGLGRRPLMSRRRIQLIGAILVSAFIPYVFRVLTRLELFDPAIINTLWANTAAVVIAVWARLSIEPYPGIRQSYVILPTAAVAHSCMLVLFLMTRLPYDRLGLTSGFLLHVVWAYAIYFLVQRRLTLRIAIVPFGNVDRLTEIENVDWVRLTEPRLERASRCDAIVADFSVDLPDRWESFLADAALLGGIVYHDKQLSESLTGRVRIDHISENSFGMLLPARGYFHLKTLLDTILAAVALPFLVPILLIAAVCIYIVDGGPVIFKQNRVGYSGRPITVYKFRTMSEPGSSADMEAVRQALATHEADPRITRLGAFLRRSRIDELPQVWNILKREMSWIGPRPEPEELSNWFSTEIPFYRYRHVVKPGISGWAQVNQGYTSGVPGITRKLEFDFYYIKYFSPWLDILILFSTIRTMFTGSGSR